MDSNSGAPWFGFDLSLPRKDARRKTLETIRDNDSTQPYVQWADDVEETKQPVVRRGALSRWLNRSEQAIPLPSDAPAVDEERVIELQGPREEFRYYSP